MWIDCLGPLAPPCQATVAEVRKQWLMVTMESDSCRGKKRWLMVTEGRSDSYRRKERTVAEGRKQWLMVTIGKE